MIERRNFERKKSNFFWYLVCSSIPFLSNSLGVYGVWVGTIDSSSIDVGWVSVVYSSTGSINTVVDSVIDSVVDSIVDSVVESVVELWVFGMSDVGVVVPGIRFGFSITLSKMVVWISRVSTLGVGWHGIGGCWDNTVSIGGWSVDRWGLVNELLLGNLVLVDNWSYGSVIVNSWSDYWCLVNGSVDHWSFVYELLLMVVWVSVGLVREASVGIRCDISLLCVFSSLHLEMILLGGSNRGGVTGDSLHVCFIPMMVLHEGITVRFRLSSSNCYESE